MKNWDAKTDKSIMYFGRKFDSKFEFIIENPLENVKIFAEDQCRLFKLL
jgi:hypothetical protein